MSARHFECVQERAEGRKIDTYRLTCGRCGRTENIGQQSMGHTMADDLVPKKFRVRGWIVGRRSQDDRCPGCSQAIKADASRKKAHDNGRRKLIERSIPRSWTTG
jgi:hypothetical protein